MKKHACSHNSATTLIPRVTQTIITNRLLKEGDKVIVGVSGGADSLALLCILHAIRINLQLIAVYVDHGLRPTEIPREIETIGTCCRGLKVPFVVHSIDVTSFAEKNKRSIEDSARFLRYEIFHKLFNLHSAGAIAVGHNADDQVEEFFLRAIRGSSRKSLSGMDFKNDPVIRPLLNIRKTELTDFLKANDIPWCLDSSNLSRNYLRNRVRLDLLPLLKNDFNPSINKTILQNMDILREEEKFLETSAMVAYQECVICTPESNTDANGERLTLRSEIFSNFHPAIRRRVLEKCCWKMSCRPSYEQICALMELVIRGNTGGEIHLAAGLRVIKTVETLFFSRPLPSDQTRGSSKPVAVAEISIPRPGQYLFKELNTELTLEEIPVASVKRNDTEVLYIDRAKIDFPLLCRSSILGERFHPLGAPGSKKVARFFSDKKVPAKTRPSCPVLLSNNQVVALPGLQVDEKYKVTGATITALRIGWKSIDI